GEVLEPTELGRAGRGKVDDLCLPLGEKGQRKTGHQISAPDVDVQHEVQVAGFQLMGSGQRKSGGIIDQQVDAPKQMRTFLYCPDDLLFVPDIAGNGQGFAPGFLYFAGGSINGSPQSGVFLYGFGYDGNVGPLPGQSQGHGLPNPATGSGN